MTRSPRPTSLLSLSLPLSSHHDDAARDAVLPLFLFLSRHTAHPSVSLFTSTPDLLLLRITSRVSRLLLLLDLANGVAMLLLLPLQLLDRLLVTRAAPQPSLLSVSLACTCASATHISSWMYLMRLQTLSRDSLTSCRTSAGPISLKTRASSSRRSSSCHTHRLPMSLLPLRCITLTSFTIEFSVN